MAKSNNHRLVLLGLIVVVMMLTIMTGCDKQTAEESFDIYKGKWEKMDYEGMYQMLSADSKEYISKEDFIGRYSKIYGDIGAKEISIKVKDNEEEEENPISFSMKMDTIAESIEINDFEVSLIKEEIEGDKTWAIQWDESLIFPQMDAGDKVRIKTLKANRGEIFDKDGNGLAVNGDLLSIGLHPRLFEEEKEQNIIKLAEVLDIEKSIIEEKLDKNKDPDDFVPIVKISPNHEEKLSKLVAINGVLRYDAKGRVYPGGEAFGALIGYVKPITAEELEGLKGQGYNAYSSIGNLGLEELYEGRLRARDGKRIYISKQSNGEETDQIILGEKEPQDGEDIKLTIDTELQKEIYNEMGGDVGASTAIDPITGEVLAMVSSPSFDSNLYSTYIPDSKWEEWDSTEVNEKQNRFNDAYSPGSTFKLITAAIGLETGVIDPNKKMNIEGNQWQPDESWGDYKVTRVSDKKSQVDLTDAFVYSDNIYFAKNALDIGIEKFLEESKKFGFQEELSVGYPMESSQIANDNKITKEVLLADSGYGQGEVLMNPLHVALVYSSIVNDGNMMNPILDISKGESTKVWKENVISQENREILKSALTQVIENKDGTAHEAKINGLKLAGKTGTAELKKDLEDKESEENGWFVAMNTENPEIVVSMIIEGVKDKGGSHYVVPKVRNIIDYYLGEN